MSFIVGVVIALALFALIIFPEFRKKLKVLAGGFLNVFVEDAAKTPEGAQAVFNQAIEEVQHKYNMAARTYNKMIGELRHAEANLASLKTQLREIETACENFAKRGDRANAEVYASRRLEVLSDIKQREECIVRWKPMVEDAKNIHEAYGKKLRELKRTSKETVNKMKMNGQLNDLLGDLDELKRESATDKLLGTVMDGASDLQKETDGARAVHENRLSTKMARAEAEAAKVQSDAYLDELMRKYSAKE